jgi:membrane-bound lytic murein transglycosylase D
MLMLFVLFLLTSGSLEAQTPRYEDMSRVERLVFVREQARRITFEMSGTEYKFTPEFEVDIQKAVTHYAERIGRPEKSDLRLVLERGQSQAPLLIAVFKARNISPLIGLYLPWIESEYQNLQSPSPMGALGVFQFLPKTGERFGLSPQDLLDVSKSADAAARYITETLETFKNDPMKEALAILAYNRGAQKTARDLKILLNDQNKGCSVCALTADRSKLDETYKYENTLYLPRFFAAAIIGENPAPFGVEMRPLSSH